MKISYSIGGLLSGLLAVALILPVCGINAAAGEMTVPPALPQATTETTLPSEPTEAPAEATEVPPETTQAAASPEEPTQPPEAAPVTVSVSYARGLEAGAGEFQVTATVTYRSQGLTILQDSTGGIPADLPEGTSFQAGDLVKVWASRSSRGILVREAVVLGSQELPLLTANLGTAEENLRIQVRDAVFSQGTLRQKGTSLPTVPQTPAGIAEGQRVNAVGVISGGRFYLETLVPLSPAAETLPKVTATPEDRKLLQGENIALYCEEPEAGIYYSLSYDEGQTYEPYAPYSGGVVLEGTSPRVWVRAQARREGSAPGPEETFVFTREVPAAMEAGDQGTSAPESWQFYFGQLHAHTHVQLGQGQPEAAYTWAKEEMDMDFFAVTEYGHSLNTDEWNAGKQAAEAVSGPEFAGLFGYEFEFSDSYLGHITTFGTQSWLARDKEKLTELTEYYDLLTGFPGSVSQFNHPGTFYGYFHAFDDYHPKYDAVIQLLELGTGEQACVYYQLALDKGWHVAPTCNREGQWGEPLPDRESPTGRTVILASDRSEQALYEAMSSRRVYAALDEQTEVYYTLNGAPMGSILSQPARIIQVSLGENSPPIDTLEVVTEGGSVYARLEGQASQSSWEIPIGEQRDYFYLRLYRAGELAAVTAPVWIEQTTDFGISGFRADKTELTQGEPVTVWMELYNNERQDFLLERVEVIQEGGGLVHSEAMPQTLGAVSTWKGSFLLPNSSLGAVTLRLVVEGTIGGEKHSFDRTLELSYKPQSAETPCTDISEVRVGRDGALYRVRGYVTSGTSNPSTTFQNRIYLQDDSGGISVAAFREPGVEIGMAVEILGIRQMDGDNPELLYVDHQLLQEDAYRYVPVEVYASGMDPANYGGQLLQVEGKVQNLTRTADGWGVSWFTLKDVRGDTVTVQIEPEICSGSSGENRLVGQVQAGRSVRAVGILHVEQGKSVLRVRNCDEVVYVPPRMDPTNPKTEAVDRLCLPLAVLWASTAGLLTAALFKKQKKLSS